DFNTDMGVPGYAPLIYRPLVAEYPITLVAIPGAIPGLYEPFAAVSGLQAVPFSDSFAIWNTLSPHQTLQVQNTVLLTNDMAAPQLDPQMMVSMLSVNCTDCRHAFQLNINPEYMEKLVWNTGVFIGARRRWVEGLLLEMLSLERY
ncbi:MAG: hypothetical protein IPL78_14415, partial [Chloroflexi bacterium]|nr:hypothetical protein [Chloroflexota bacterium]